jgi:hypothetical protein
MLWARNMNESTSTIVELAAALRELHHALLESAREEYERTHGPVPGPGQLFHLVVNDPSFAWLRVLSEVMADLDELLDEEHPASADEQAAIRHELDEIFSPAAPRAFWDRCSPLLQQSDVVIAYARVRSLLARLPPSPPLDAAARLHAQHRWAVARRKHGTP